MKKLLVVEDSPTQAAELSILLETQGFEVEVARDGASGLKRCRAASFDAVLSDVVMPEIDGYELCRRIKADPDIHELPAVPTISSPSRTTANTSSAVCAACSTTGPCAAHARSRSASTCS